MRALINSQLENKITISKSKVFLSALTGYISIGPVVKSLYFFQIIFTSALEY